MADFVYYQLLLVVAGLLITAWIEKKPEKGILFGGMYFITFSVLHFLHYNQFYRKGVNTLSKISSIFFWGPSLFLFMSAALVKSWWLLPAATVIIPVFGLAGWGLTWSLEEMHQNVEPDPLRETECYAKAVEFFASATDLDELSVKQIQFEKQGAYEDLKAVQLAYDERKKALYKKKYSWLLLQE